jgi:hypothetical protein
MPLKIGKVEQTILDFMREQNDLLGERMPVDTAALVVQVLALSRPAAQRTLRAAAIIPSRLRPIISGASPYGVRCEASMIRDTSRHFTTMATICAAGTMSLKARIEHAAIKAA